MAKSYKDVYELWKDQSSLIVSSPKKWMSFLNTASWMYKYRFEDQILIYAQRPQAKACAEFDVWNDKLHRWIKSGSKGIALLRDDGPYLRYVFDIADTRSPTNKELLLWAIQPKDHFEMIEMIGNKYDIEHCDDLGTTLLAMATIVSDDNCLDYMESLLKYREGSNLEHLEEEEVKRIFSTLVKNSISYELLKRCGIDANEYLSEDDFFGIRYFDNLEMIGQLGVACHDLGEMAFQDISRKAREIMNRTFAENHEFKQNDSRKSERNDQNERIDIQPSERLSAPKSERGTTSAEQQIRKDAVEISEGEPSGTPVRVESEQRIEQSLTVDRSTGKRNDGNTNESINEESKNDDTQQGNEPIRMGVIHEQYEDASRGNRIEGDHIQLDLDIEDRGGNDTKLPPFNMNDLPQLLREDIGLKHSKKEIVDFFHIHDVNERIEYLKECYDETLIQTYRNPILHDYSYLGYKRINYQLEIWHGNYLKKQTSSTMSFSEIEQEISKLIEKDEYLVSPESRMSGLQRAYHMKILNRNVDKAVYSHVDELNYTASEVIAFFNQEKDEKARVAYVKRLYPDERVEFVVDDVPLGYQKFEDHLFVYMGTFEEPIDSAEHSWRLVASMIDGLILSRYYAPSIQIPTLEEQKQAVYESIENFENGKYFSQEEIDRVLVKGSGFEDGKYRIYEQMQKHESEAVNVNFLKREYGIGGSMPAIGFIDENHDSKGICLWKGNIFTPDVKITLKWKQVNKRINELIAIDRYLSPVEKKHYPIFLQQQIEKELEYKRKQKEKELGIESKVEEVEVVEPSQEMDYQWKLGDRVYIGIQEYEIIEDGEQIVLQDKEFPLFTETYARDVFKSILKDTALNDALLQPVIQEEKALLTEVNEETLYQKYLPIFVERIKHSEIYPVLRDRETSVEEANDLIHSEMISVIGSMNAEHPEIYQKYVSDEHFRQSMIDDIVGRTYEDIADSSSHAEDFKASYDYHAEEINLLNRILYSLKIDDIDISWDDELDMIIASDGDNTWIGKEFYDFLINEAIVYEDEQPSGLIEEDYQNLLDYASQLSQQSANDSRSKELYALLKQLSPRNLDGTSGHQIFMTGSDFDHPFTLYYDKDVNVIEIYHAYEIDAIEVMEPYMKMKLDISSKTLVPFYYENPVKNYQLGVEQPFEEFEDEQTMNELYSYALSWVQNIKEKGYKIESEQIFKNEDKIGVYFIDYHLDGTIKYTDMPNQELQQFLEKYGYTLADDVKIDSIESPSETKITPDKVTVKTNNAINKIDYRIDDDNLGAGTAKERYRNNVAAIRLLFSLEKENRFATKEDQEVLSKYVGWGGLSEVFDETKTSWSKEYAELKQLLNDEEYRAARESTLTAFYTSPIVIKSIYEVLYNLGFRTGNVLEPSCGIGNFFGMMPDTMNAKCYGVELDSITGRIAKQLYQNANIAVEGYEKTNLPDSFFDVAIGNVPFGQFKVLDKQYDKFNFHIHDYFFAKTIDKVRPGGIIAFITSRYTMDKSNGSVRRYINERAELLGAIRLPNTAFKDAANTLVTSDILILKKRERPIVKEDDWVYTAENERGYVMNQYFIDHPEMILGTVELTRNMYGREDITVVAHPDRSLQECLQEATSHIQGQISNIEVIDETLDTEDEIVTIPADPNVRNFSYTIVDGDVYFRENSIMSKLELSKTAKNRVMGMIEIRDCLRRLIEYQKDDYPNEVIQEEQQTLNVLYDAYTKEYGLINQRANAIVFREDSGYYLLCSLENLNEDGTLKSKADIFTKRTIRAKQEINHADNANEALLLSLSERGSIDFDYMEQLSGINKEQLISDLEGVIYKVPNVLESETKADVYVTADEYLSGDIKEKLDIAKLSAKINPSFEYHVKQLEKAMPKPLTAAEIEVRLGATWIPVNIYEDFMHELLNMSYYAKDHIHIVYANDSWFITHKTWDKQNIKSEKTYGTARANAYRLIEESLNLKSIKIFDYEIDDDGKKKAVLNKRDTMIAQQKQDSIKEKFHDWIWKDYDRREQLVKLYNDTFNTFRPREYDGSHLSFPNMNSEITLKQHQKDAVAHVLYGNNVLLAHVVGAGKTFEMVAACMELKRLGLSQKAMFVVPNHLIEQWGAEFLQLYPSANILVTKKQDFEKSKRKKFCSRIATGDYDAIIIGHSMFEKIPVSVERQRHFIMKQIEDITRGIKELEEKNGERHSIKQLEKTKKSLSTRIESLNDDSRKDDVITFEELGVDRLFVDESHYYKNLFLYTKMRNVAGLSTQEAKKSSDMFMKCQYLNELNGGKGIVFATGTPISNSMTEMYTIQRYLQYDSLAKRGLEHFDSWASTFGETVSAIELAPEGTGYQMKTRFAKFYNLPELISLFKDVADIKTADMLDLPVPNAHYESIAVKPSEIQKEIISSLADRAQKVRDGNVDPHIDNMLKITNDGRKLAMDQRLIDPNLPEFESSKVNTCIHNVLDIYKRTEQERLTQLVFCDISTPNNSLKALYEDIQNYQINEESISMDFTNIYNEIAMKLVNSGVSKDEIAFMHDADTDAKKKELFAKVRAGNVRILLGSTQKMGAGTNVQTRLIAIHDLDCPWRPSDLEQRAGRIVRQGNQNSDVYIYRYVTEQTFDAYLYQLVENKQKFISQIMTSKIPVRSAEDFDEASLSYAEIKALASGNPMIKEKMDLDNEVKKLRIAQANYQSERYEIENRIYNYYPNLIESITRKIGSYQRDIESTPEVNDFCGMTINDVFYDSKEAAGNALLLACKSIKTTSEIYIGEYRKFAMWLSYDAMQKSFEMTLLKSTSYKTLLGNDVFGNLQRLDNLIASIPKKLEVEQQLLENAQLQLENAKEELEKPFEKEEELKVKTKRLSEVNKQLDIGKESEHDADFIDTVDESEEIKKNERER